MTTNHPFETVTKRHPFGANLRLVTPVTQGMLPLSDPDLTAYRHWLIADSKSPDTIRQRLGFARSRLRAWGTFDQPVHTLVEWLQQHHGYTYNTYLGHLRSIYGWLTESGQMLVNPTVKIRRAPKPRLRPNPIPVDLFTAALAGADHRMRTWISLGALAGMRCHEIAKLSGSDIDEHSLTIHGKGGILAVVPTHPDLWSLAQHYPRNSWWFPSPQRDRDHICTSTIGNAMRAHFRAVGIDTGAAHRLRHTYCTNLSRAGVRPRVTQELMRHASLETTMRYDAVDDDERNDAIRRLVLPMPAA